MKKLIAALMAIAILLSLCACGSAPKQKELKDFSTAELQEELMRRMTGEEEVTSAQTSNEVGPIEDYLVTVEMTPENFGNYWEFDKIPVLDEWGEPTGVYMLGMKSKVYNQGLHFIDPYWNPWFEGSDDFQFEFEVIEPSLEKSYTNTANRGAFKDWMEFSYHESKDEDCQIVVKRVKGTVSFIKTSYIQYDEIYDTGKTSGHDCSYIRFHLLNGNSIDVRYFNDIDTRY